MKQILRNLRGLWRTERLLLMIMVLCIFSSALLMQFSYGLYQNYHVIRNEAELELQSIDLTVAEGKTLTPQIVMDYVEALPQNITDRVDVFSASANLGRLEDHIPMTAETQQLFKSFFGGISHDDGAHFTADTPLEELGLWLDLRFQYRSRVFRESELWQGNIIKNNNLKWFPANTYHLDEIAPLLPVTETDAPRFFSAQEYADGEQVAMIGSVDAGIFLTAPDTLSLFGREYRVIGANQQISLEIPLTALPADCALNPSLALHFDRNIDRSVYNCLVETADAAAPGVFVFPQMQFPDTESIYLYNNIMLISALIAVLSVLNFVLLYQYILQRRSRSLAIFRMTGCTALRAVRMYLGECMCIGIPVYATGVGVFLLLLKYVFAGLFPYMAESYNPRVYAAIFAMYLITMLVMLIVMIAHHVRQNILDEFYGREAR